MTAPLTGSMYEIRVSISDPNGPADPTTLVVQVKKPSGSVFSPAISRVGTGIYVSSFVLDEAGVYSYRWQGTGIATGVCVGSFHVQSSNL
jgi:hypothetical protein